MSDEALEHEEAFPHLTRDLLAVLEAAGERRTLTKGDVLSRAGEVAREFCVVISGSLAGYEDHGSTTEHPIRVIGKGRFWGGTNLLTGQPAYLTTVAAEDSEVIVLSIDQLRGVIAASQQLGDLILGAFVARRALLVGLGAGLRLVGSRLSPDTRRLREFLARNRIPHGFVDVESDEQAEALLRELGVAPPRDAAAAGRPDLAAQPDERRGGGGAQSQTCTGADTGGGRHDCRCWTGRARCRGLCRLRGAHSGARRFDGDRRPGR